MAYGDIPELFILPLKCSNFRSDTKVLGNYNYGDGLVSMILLDSDAHQRYPKNPIDFSSDLC